MKVLPACTASFLLCSALGASEAMDVNFLSSLKQQQIALETRKAVAESSKLKDAWIQPITLRYSYSKSNPYDNTQVSKNAAIVMDQPIFQSGGIYYAVKYAKAYGRYSELGVEAQKRALIKETLSLLMQIRQNGLRIEKQQLLIANAQINLEQQRELYMNGQLDSGLLDRAIIDKNSMTLSLFDLQAQQEKLISAFHQLSDLDYKTAELPTLELVEESAFVEHNIDAEQLKSQARRDRYYKSVTMAKYLPKLSITAGYNWDRSENVQFGNFATFSAETDYYNYGFKLSMPLDVNAFADMESSRVDHLKSLVLIEDKKRELVATYEQVTQNLQNYDRKIALASENETLYGRLLGDTKTLYEAGYKTAFDVENLENSFAIQDLDRRIYALDKQLELLSLYEKMLNEV